MFSVFPRLRHRKADNTLNTSLRDIVRPVGVHYNHSVSPLVRPSIHGQLVKMLITLEPNKETISMIHGFYS